MRSWTAAALASLLLAGCAGTGAETPTTTTTSVPVPALTVAAWEGMSVELICLRGSETYEGVPGSHTPIIDAVAGAIDDDRSDAVGARVSASECDIIITFDLQGQPLAETYTGSATGTTYTGATVEGTITLSAEAREPMAADLTAHIDPPESFLLPEWEEPPGEPQDAPFWPAVKDGVCAAFAGWFEGTDLTDLLMAILGSWPPRDDECGSYAETHSPFGDLGS